MLLLSIWRHSQVVRQRSAKSPPPVRVWVSPPKRRTRRSRVLLFGFRALWALHLFDFICSGGMNPPGIKVLPAGKTLVRRKSAAPLCGAPGSGIYSVKTLQKERHSSGMSFFLGFAAFGGSTRFILAARAQWIAPASAFPPAAICLPRRKCGGASAFIAAAQKLNLPTDSPLMTQ